MKYGNMRLVTDYAGEVWLPFTRIFFLGLFFSCICKDLIKFFIIELIPNHFVLLMRTTLLWTLWSRQKISWNNENTARFALSFIKNDPLLIYCFHTGKFESSREPFITYRPETIHQILMMKNYEKRRWYDFLPSKFYLSKKRLIFSPSHHFTLSLFCCEKKWREKKTDVVDVDGA